MSEAALGAGLQRRASAREIGFFRAFFRFFSELREAVLQALRSLLMHKLRASLTILGISIGIATVIAVSSAAIGLDEAFGRQLATLGPNTLYVSPRPWIVDGSNWWKYRNRPAVGQGDWRAIERFANLPLAVAPIAGTQGVVGKGGKEIKNVFIRGTTESFLETGSWALKRGRFISNIDHEVGTDACVIGADIEDAIFPNQDPIGQQLRVGPIGRCTVVGSLVRRGNSFGQSQDMLIVLPLSAFLRTFGQKRGVTIAVVAPTGKVTETEDEVVAVVRNYRRLAPDKDDNFAVNRQDRMLNMFGDMTKQMKLVVFVIGFITAIVGGIGVMNILLVSVKERTREIGIRRALGARKLTILLQFLCEAVVVSCVGGFLGTAIGLAGANIVSIVTPLAASVNPMIVVAGVAFSAAVGLIFGLWPAWSAASLNPIEALRYE
jgi:putative ABC transport system permease protein